MAGDLLPPPLHHLTGALPIDVEEGTITWTMPASSWLCSPTGSVEGGFLVYLADAAIATASATLTPAGTSSVPIDVTVKLLRPVPPDGGQLTAAGRVLNHGRSLSVATADITTPMGSSSPTALGSSLLVQGKTPAAEASVEEVPQADLR